MLQEMKVQEDEDFRVKSIWGTKEIHWSTKYSIGRSIGLLTMWNPNQVQPFHSLDGDIFVGAHLF